MKNSGAGTSARHRHTQGSPLGRGGIRQSLRAQKLGYNCTDPHHRRTRMALGYDGKLYILAFDHRGSFQKKMFGIEGEPTAEETEQISDAKHLIFEGMLVAVERGVDAAATGVLVDEQFGSDIPER